MTELNKERMIPLHIADQAVAACNKEIAELRAQVAELKQQPDPLTAYLYAAELAKADIKKLKAEVDRLTAELDQSECDHDNCQKRKVSIDNHRFELFTENKNLKAEVDRLRKAGDALAETLEGAGFDSVMDFWNAAKEGKQP